jgi:putative flippase GtrA
MSPAAAEFGRYFAASALALAADVAVLLLAARVMHYLIAASLAFAVGAVISYLLATRWVFRRRRLAHRRHTEFAAYVVIGIVGLGINDLVIFLAAGVAGMPLLGAKIIAAGVTFFVNYLARKLSLF